MSRIDALKILKVDVFSVVTWFKDHKLMYTSQIHCSITDLKPQKPTKYYSQDMIAIALNQFKTIILDDA